MGTCGNVIITHAQYGIYATALKHRWHYLKCSWRYHENRRKCDNIKLIYSVNEHHLSKYTYEGLLCSCQRSRVPRLGGYLVFGSCLWLRPLLGVNKCIRCSTHIHVVLFIVGVYIVKPTLPISNFTPQNIRHLSCPAKLKHHTTYSTSSATLV